MARATDLSTGQMTPATAACTVRRNSRRRVDVVDCGNSMHIEATSEFNELAQAVRVELRPTGPIETVLIDRIVVATWKLRTREDGVAEIDDPETCQAERSLRSGLRALVRLRSLRAPGPIVAEPVRVFDPGPLNDAVAWRDRLTWDDAVSQDSPVVRGTWITVGQVVSRIIDGWSWADVLRAHPELCEDDIRACLAFTVEDEEVR